MIQRITARTTLVLSLILLTLASGCGSDSATGPDNSDDLGFDQPEPQYDVEYTDDAVVLDGAQAASLVSFDTATGAVVLDESQLDDSGASISEGTVLLVANKLLRKVTGVTDDGGHLTLTTEDAKLTDLISNGTIAWDFTPEITSARTVRWKDRKGATIASTSYTADNPISFPIKRDITVGDYTYEMEFDAAGNSNGHVDKITVKFVASKKVNGKASVAFTGQGTFNVPKQTNEMTIAERKLQSFSNSNSGVDCDITVSLAAAGSGLDDISLTFPNAAISIPVEAIPTPGGLIPIPIPVTIDIGVQMVAKMVVTAEASATVSSQFHYNGSSGLEYNGTTISTRATVGDTSMTPKSADAASVFNPVDAQLGIAVPRVSLNIAGFEVAAIYPGFTVGSQLSFSPTCKKAYVKMTAEAKYDLTFLGPQNLKDKHVFWEDNHTASQEGCP